LSGVKVSAPIARVPTYARRSGAASAIIGGSPWNVSTGKLGKVNRRRLVVERIRIGEK